MGAAREEEGSCRTVCVVVWAAATCSVNHPTLLGVGCGQTYGAKVIATVATEKHGHSAKQIGADALMIVGE